MCVILMLVRAVLIVNRKRDNYRLDVKDINFWIRHLTDKNGYAYIKGSFSEACYLYMQRIKDDKYIDYITNRVFTMQEDGDYLIIWPSGVKVPKNRLEECNDIEEVSTEILSVNSKKIKYFILSEGMIYESYFCAEFAYFYGINVIPASYVDESIKYIKINCSDDTYNRERKLVQ